MKWLGFDQLICFARGYGPLDLLKIAILYETTSGDLKIDQVHILASGKIRFASVEYFENFAHSKNEIVQEKREIAKSNKENESELTSRTYLS